MQVAIVGGGIAGLTTAYYLQKAGIDFTLIESEARFGGKIKTDCEDGFLIEGGPDSFMAQKPAILELCRELGLEKELIGTNVANKGTFIWSRRKLQPMPEGVMLIIPTKIMPFVKSSLFSWRGKLRMALEPFIPRQKGQADESLAHFMRRRLGKEALERLAEPMVAGIYVADAERLSLRSTFPRFLDMEQKYGSLLGGIIMQKRAAKKNSKSAPPPGFLTFQGGLGELVETLTARLKPGSLLPAVSVVAVRQNGNQYALSLSNGTQLQAEAIVFATPAYVTARLVADFDPALAEKLQAIGYVSTATVSLGFKRSEVGQVLNGFGFVVPSSEKRKIKACSWSSAKFDNRAPNDMVLLRAFVGGAKAEELAEQDEATMIAMVRQELELMLDIRTTPVLTKVYRWQKANPQYDVGHATRIAKINELSAQNQGIYLTGAAYNGVGVPDCIAHAKQLAGVIIQKAERQANYAHLSR